MDGSVGQSLSSRVEPWSPLARIDEQLQVYGGPKKVTNAGTGANIALDQVRFGGATYRR